MIIVHMLAASASVHPRRPLHGYPRELQAVAAIRPSQYIDCACIARISECQGVQKITVGIGAVVQAMRYEGPMWDS